MSVLCTPDRVLPEERDFHCAGLMISSQCFIHRRCGGKECVRHSSESMTYVSHQNEAGTRWPCAMLPRRGDGKGTKAPQRIHRQESPSRQLGDPPDPFIGGARSTRSDDSAPSSCTGRVRTVTCHSSGGYFVAPESELAHAAQEAAPAVSCRRCGSGLKPHPRPWPPGAPPHTSARNPRCRRRGPPRRWAARCPWRSGPTA